MVVSWAEQILELVEIGSLTEAIDLTTSYWIGRADLETIGLPSDDSIRKSMVKPKLIEIMRASLEYVFSDRRMEDDTHFDLDGRGVDRTELFEGLVRSCACACIAINQLDFIFEEMFEQYQEHGIESIFFLQLQPFILRSEISTLPTAVTQGLIRLQEDRKQFQLIDQIIRHLDPACLDINQALAICSREMLHDALVYIYTEAMDDFVGPIVEFLQLIKSIHSSRQRIQQYCQDSNTSNPDLKTKNLDKTQDGIEGLVPIAYKIFPYLSTILSGLSYPNKVPYDHSRGSKAKSEIYQFLFSGKSMHWPQPDGKLILTTEEGQQEPTYPYLRTLLTLDSEAILDTLDIAFEDSWLHDYPDGEGEKRIDRQLITNLLLEVTSVDHPEFSSRDRTFVYIFVARNLPKYSQFLSLPHSTLHSILIGLSSSSSNDESNIEDRQLAAESLLSVYTPPDVEKGTGQLLELFKKAGFWRILTSVYTQKEMWVDVVHSQLKSPDLHGRIFDELSTTLRKIKPQSKASPGKKSIEVNVIQVLLNSINQLIEINVPQTTRLIHKFRTQIHLDVVDHIGETLNQFRYLRTLLEPSELDENGSSGSMFVLEPTSIQPNLYAQIRIRYVDLLSKFDPNHVLNYLKSAPLPVDHTADIVKICREGQIYDALIWQLDRAGRTRETFEELDIILKSQATLITKSLTCNQPDQGKSSLGTYARQLTRCANTAAEICVERTKDPQDGLTGEDCWFYLLSSTVQCIQSCASLLPPRIPPSQAFPTANRHHRAALQDTLNRASQGSPSLGSQKDMDLDAIAAFQDLLPSIVSLISRTTSSNRISFSNLVRRLIESTSTSDFSTVASSKGACIPSNEFRTIILMIMDTYRFEGNVLEVTGRMIDEDLFAHVDRLAKAKERGIRPNHLQCFKCQKPILIQSHHRPPTELSDEDNKYEEEDGEEDEEDEHHPDQLQLIEKLGLPAASVTPLRKQSVKGKEVEQGFQGVPSTSTLSPSTFNQCTNPRLHHDLNVDSEQDSDLGDSFLNRNPNPTHPNRLFHHHHPSSFLLGPPPRSLLFNHHHYHSTPASPSSSPSRSTLKPSSSVNGSSPLRTFQHLSAGPLLSGLDRSSSPTPDPAPTIDKPPSGVVSFLDHHNHVLPKPAGAALHTPKKQELVPSIGLPHHNHPFTSEEGTPTHHRPLPSGSITHRRGLLSSKNGDRRGTRKKNPGAIVLANDGKCFHFRCWNDITNHALSSRTDSSLPPPTHSP